MTLDPDTLPDTVDDLIVSPVEHPDRDWSAPVETITRQAVETIDAEIAALRASRDVINARIKMLLIQQRACAAALSAIHRARKDDQ